MKIQGPTKGIDYTLYKFIRIFRNLKNPAIKRAEEIVGTAL